MTKKKEAKTTDKRTDVVQCVEEILGKSIDYTGEVGQMYVAGVKAKLSEQGIKMEKGDVKDSGVQLAIVRVGSDNLFRAVIIKNQKVTLDPSDEITEKTRVQIMARYKLTQPTKKAEPKEKE